MKGEADYHRRLSADMAEAERQAQINALDDTSAWEKLCKIRDALGEKINQPTPPRRIARTPPPPPANIYDREYQRALYEVTRGLSS